MSSNEGVEYRRNRLPQWRLDQGVYFITFCLVNRACPMTAAEKTLVADSIRHHKRYRLNIFVVMDDHVHMLIQTMPGEDLSKILKTIKSFTARQINLMRGERGPLWQRSNYTQLLRNGVAIDSRREYIYSNPARRWGMEPSTYQWLEWFE